MISDKSDDVRIARIMGISISSILITGLLALCYNAYLETKLAQEAMKQGYSQVRENGCSTPLWKKAQ